MVIDGARNAAAMERLLETWRDFLASRGSAGARAHLVFGAVSDKDITGMARLLLPHIKRVTLVRLSSERSADPADLARYFPGVSCAFLDSVAAWRPVGDLPVLVTGSLFLAGEMLAHLTGAEHDLQLNERLATVPSAP
jgi:folylpolyglutamate synthase/dihydropteroate synthase